MQVIVKDISETSLSVHNGFLLQNENTLLYYSYSYLNLLKDYLECEVKMLWAMDGEKPVGLFPLAFKKSERYGCVCNSLPFYGSNGSMVVLEQLDPEQANLVRKELLTAAVKLIEAYKCSAVTFVTNPFDTETNNYIKDNFSYDYTDERVGQITPLPEYSEQLEQELFNQFEDPRPRNIRKAIKSGITVHKSSVAESLDFLYQTHYQNISAIGGIAKERKFFEKIPVHFQEGSAVYIARQEDKIIAALLLFYFNKTVEYFTPAVQEEFRGLQPTALIIFEAMKDAAKDGYRFWNWGGTWLSQGGVYDFKKKWGTKDYPYFYYTKILDASILKQPLNDLKSSFPNFYLFPYNKVVHDSKD